MNIFLWVLQVVLALHTLIGAFWKFSNSEQAVGSLSAIPHPVWLGFIVIEIICAIALLLPALSKNLGILAPIAASVIAVEMLLFCVVHLYSGQGNSGEIIYWIVVAAVCMFVAYGRFVLKPF